jgi:hypothetical protein
MAERAATARPKAADDPVLMQYRSEERGGRRVLDVIRMLLYITEIIACSR